MEDIGALYDQHVHAVLRWTVRAVGDAETGADLTAEVFATALLEASRFDPARGDAGAWLFGIARNKVRMYHRTGAVEMRARRRLGLARVELSDEGIERVERLASLDVDGLGAALDVLPRDQRDAVVARVVDERSYDEIAAAADVTPALARQRVSRGLRTLRRRMEER